MNDRAKLTAGSFIPSVLATVLLLTSSGEMQAQTAESRDTSAVQPQRAASIFRFQERPAAADAGTTPASAQNPAPAPDSRTPQSRTPQARTAPPQRAADPMRFAPAPPVVASPTQTATTESAQAPPPRRPVASAPPQRPAVDPMRFAPAPPPTPKPEARAPEPAPGPIASSSRNKDKAAPAPIRTAPAPRFEVRAPGSSGRSDEVYPGADEEIPVDEPPQFDPAEVTSKVHYPEDAIRDGIHGRVLVRVLINRNGGVLKRIVEYSSSHALDTAAVNAVAATRFTPAKLKGVAVAAWITVPVNFVLTPEATEPRRSY